MLFSLLFFDLLGKLDLGLGQLAHSLTKGLIIAYCLKDKELHQINVDSPAWKSTILSSCRAEKGTFEDPVCRSWLSVIRTLSSCEAPINKTHASQKVLPEKCGCQHQDTSKCCDSELHWKSHIQSIASLKTDCSTVAPSSTGEKPQSMHEPEEQSGLMTEKIEGHWGGRQVWQNIFCAPPGNRGKN